jgi:hypothetical protein
LTPSKIFVFTEQTRANPLLEALQAQFGKTDLQVFSTLSECVMEALDLGPRLVIFDVAAAAGQVLIQIGRIRTDRLHGEMAVVVRAQRLDEPTLARLYELGVNDVLLTLMPLNKSIERIKLIYDDPQSEAVRQTHLKLGAGLAAHGVGLEITTVSPAMSEAFRKQYRLDLIPSAVHGTWGLVPLGEKTCALFCADFQGEDMTVAAQSNRLHAMVRAEGYDRANPQATLSFLSRGMAGFLRPGQAGVMIYCVFDLAAGTVRASTAGPGAMLHGRAGTNGFSALPHDRLTLNNAPLTPDPIPAPEVDQADFAQGDFLVMECAADRLGLDEVRRGRPDLRTDWRTGLIAETRDTPVDDIAGDVLQARIAALRPAEEALGPLLVIQRR